MEFIQKYGRADGSDDNDDGMSKYEDGEDSVVRDEFVDGNFIGDSAENDQDQDQPIYRLGNVTRDLQEALLDPNV